MLVLLNVEDMLADLGCTAVSAVLSDQCELVSDRRSAPLPCRCSGHDTAPLGQCNRAADLVGLSVDEVTFLAEVVVNLSVD